MVLKEVIISNEYVQALAIFFFTLAAATVIHFIFKNIIKKAVERTKSDIDDIFFNLIEKKVYVLIIFFGIFIAIKSVAYWQKQAALMNSIFFIFCVLMATWLINDITTLLVSKWFEVKRNFDKTPKLVVKIIDVIAFIVAILIILNYFKINISPLIATLGLAGLAVSLALKDTIANFFAGMHIISDKPIKVGDYIEVQGAISGFVEDIWWRSTRIRTSSNNLAIIPNSKLVESIIINYDLPVKETQLTISLTILPKSDLKAVERAANAAAESVKASFPSIVKTIVPTALFSEFTDKGIKLNITILLEQIESKEEITHELIKEIKKQFDKAKIQLVTA